MLNKFFVAAISLSIMAPSAFALTSAEVVSILKSSECVKEVLDISTGEPVEVAPVEHLNESGHQLFYFSSHAPVQFCFDEILPKIPEGVKTIAIHKTGVLAVPVK